MCKFLVVVVFDGSVLFLDTGPHQVPMPVLEFRELASASRRECWESMPVPPHLPLGCLKIDSQSGEVAHS